MARALGVLFYGYIYGRARSILWPGARRYSMASARLGVFYGQG